MDLLDRDGNFLSFNEFKCPYSLEKTNFLQCSQVVSAIPNHLLQKARELIAFSDGSVMNDYLTCFPLDENNNINLLKTKPKLVTGCLSTNQVQIHKLTLNGGVNRPILNTYVGKKFSNQSIKRV